APRREPVPKCRAEQEALPLIHAAHDGTHSGQSLLHGTPVVHVQPDGASVSQAPPEGDRTRAIASCDYQTSGTVTREVLGQAATDLAVPARYENVGAPALRGQVWSLPSRRAAARRGMYPLAGGTDERAL